MHLLFGATTGAIALRAAIGAAVAVTIAAVGLRAQALARSGALATIAVGTLGFACGGPVVALALILFFVSGSVLSRITTAQAQQARSHAQKQGERDALQVFANGGVAIGCATAGQIAALAGHDARMWLAASVGALAAASGDTWATEIGSLVGGTPRSILTLRPVERGASGGVTAIGLVASAAGGAFVGLAGLSDPAYAAIKWIALACTSGFLGSLLDSIVGASLQALWRCPQCGRSMESPRHEACKADPQLVRGWAWLDNDGVNLFATVLGAAVGALVARA